MPKGNFLYEKYKNMRYSAVGSAVLNTIAKGENRTQKYNDQFFEFDGGEVDALNVGAEHPNRRGKGGSSTAFGRYKIVKGTWDAAAKKLGITDIRDKENQNIVATYLADQTGAIQKFEKGDIKGGIFDLGKTWASLPKNNKLETIAKNPDKTSVIAKENIADYQNSYIRNLNVAKSQNLVNSPKERNKISEPYFKKIQDIKSLNLSPQEEQNQIDKVRNKAFIEGNGEVLNNVIDYRIKQNEDKKNTLDLLGKYSDNKMNIDEVESLRNNLSKKGIKVYDLNTAVKKEGNGVYIDPKTGKSFNNYGKLPIDINKTISNMGSMYELDYGLKPINYSKGKHGFDSETVPEPIIDNSTANENSSGNSSSNSSGAQPATSDNSASTENNSDKRQWTPDAMLDHFKKIEPYEDTKFKYTPGKREIPYDALVSATQGLMGMQAANVNIKYRDDKVSEGLLRYAGELEQIKNIGLPPEIEGDLHMKLADAYQTGISNMVHASNGNRNLVLGNQGQLDNARMEGIVKIATMDMERRDKAMAGYGEVQKYISEYNSNRDIANNERHYREDEKKQMAGAKLAEIGMSGLIDSIQAQRENGPGSANDMFKQLMMFHISGLNKDAKPGSPGSPEDLERIRKLNDAIKSESDKFKQRFIQSDPKTQQVMDAFVKKNPQYAPWNNQNYDDKEAKDAFDAFTGTADNKKAFNELNGTSDDNDIIRNMFAKTSTKKEDNVLEGMMYTNSGGVQKKQNTRNADGTVNISDDDLGDEGSGSTTLNPVLQANYSKDNSGHYQDVFSQLQQNFQGQETKGHIVGMNPLNDNTVKSYLDNGEDFDETNFYDPNRIVSRNSRGSFRGHYSNTK
jgi:muramidase (phage lysozyme)